MPREERISRWKALMNGIRRSTVEIWRDSFVDALIAAHEPQLQLDEPNAHEAMDTEAPKAKVPAV